MRVSSPSNHPLIRNIARQHVHKKEKAAQGFGIIDIFDVNDRASQAVS